jgi:hypothetical protein
MKRKIFIIGGIILVLVALWQVTLWVTNGGWPSPGPMGDTLPPNIQYVKPADGEQGEESYGFCVHFYYLAGNGMGEESQKTVRYFLDGFHITEGIFEAVEPEYPVSVREPCYTRTEPLRSGWHTVKVKYIDNVGDEFVYMWRFQVLDEQ